MSEVMKPEVMDPDATNGVPKYLGRAMRVWAAGEVREHILRRRAPDSGAQYAHEGMVDRHATYAVGLRLRQRDQRGVEIDRVLAKLG